jgi:hypothetical protein
MPALASLLLLAFPLLPWHLGTLESSSYLEHQGLFYNLFTHLGFRFLFLPFPPILPTEPSLDRDDMSSRAKEFCQLLGWPRWKGQSSILHCFVWAWHEI